MRLAVSIAFAVLLAPLEAAAGAWTQPAGTLWAKLAATTQTSDEFLARDGAVLPDGTVVEPGDARPYDEGGRSLARELWFDLELGVTDRLTLGLQVPWKRLEYENRIETLRSWGWGDIRSTARFALTTEETRVTVRGAWKAPTGRFSTRTDRLPIGENQHDLELGLQVGRSLGRPMSWLNLEASRRFRFADGELDFDPGDEWFGAVDGGFALDASGRVALYARWDFLRGDDESLLFFAPNTALARDLDRVALAVLIDAGPVLLEAGGARVLRGRGYPTAVTWSLGVSRRIGLARPERP